MFVKYFFAFFGALFDQSLNDDKKFYFINRLIVTALKKFRFFKYGNNRIWAESAHIIIQIGLTMAGCIIFCFFVGKLIDSWLGTKGIFITIFTLLGIAGGANVIYRQIIKITEPDVKEDNSHNERD